MHCSSCAMDIDMELEDLAGVKEARTSYAKQEAEVEFDEDKLDIGQIIRAIEKSGYKANILTD